MSNNIAEYMYDETVPFVFMGLDHTLSILIFIILCFAIPYYAKTVSYTHLTLPTTPYV